MVLPVSMNLAPVVPLYYSVAQLLSQWSVDHGLVGSYPHERTSFILDSATDAYKMESANRSPATPRLASSRVSSDRRENYPYPTVDSITLRDAPSKPPLVETNQPMPTLEIHTFETYDSFAGEWHSETLSDTDISLEDARDRRLLNEEGTRQLWQLLGLLDDEELVIQLPEWLADEKGDFTKRATPTIFVGRVTRETEKAVLFEDSAVVRSLMSIAHRIHSLENGLSRTGDDVDRHDQLESRLREKQAAFRKREEMVGFRDEWIPKSQIQLAFQRKG